MDMSWCSDLANHHMELAGYFGKLRCEDGPMVNQDGSVAVDANPWAKRFCRDFGELARFDDSCWFAQIVTQRPLELFQERGDL